MSRGLRAALRQLLLELRIDLRHRRGLRRARQYADGLGLKLHLGCGQRRKPGWVNVDLGGDADLTLDLREPLPFRDGSCRVVYSEHFLEHLAYPEPAGSLLRECRRVLEPRGVLSLGVPDTEWPVLEYAGAKDEGYFRAAKERWHPAWCATRMEHLNHHFRDGEQHKFAYDFETLARALRNAGFPEVRGREFDPALDSEERRLGTLYLEALKGDD